MTIRKRRLYSLYTSISSYLFGFLGNMHARVLERRGRHRPIRPPSYRMENDYSPENMPQYFQVTVTVLEARKLVFSHPQAANSYVIVVLGKKKHRTSIRRNMQEPYFEEYFVFELYMTIPDIQRSSIWLAVMEARFCAPSRPLGEVTIDLGAIWAQPHHQVYHKWAQLSIPNDPSAGAVGFLKVDIAIIFRGEVQVMPTVVLNNEKIEDNILLPSGSEKQRANYIITIYGAFSLPNTQGHNADRQGYGKPPSTFVRVSFCGLVAKTAVQHNSNNPMYCEQVSMVEMFPNENQTIHLEICTAEGVFIRVLASADLRLRQVAHDGDNGFLPTFGPSLLHMYGNTTSGPISSINEDGPFHRGALLVALKTVVPYYQQRFRSSNVEPVTAVPLENLWSHEDFCMFCPILEVSMLDRRIAGKKCGVAITIGEVLIDNQSDEEFDLMRTELKCRKLHYTGNRDVIRNQFAYGYLNFPNAFPVLQIATCLPDFRFRMYTNNIVHGIVASLEQALADVDQKLYYYEYDSIKDLVNSLNKTLDDAAGNLLKYSDIVSHSTYENTQQYSTELDQKQLTLQKDEIDTIYQRISKRTRSISSKDITNNDEISPSRKTVKIILAETKALIQSLKNIIFKTAHGWPDIVIWLLSNGSRVAFSKISPADVIYSVIPEQCGRNCGRIQTIYLKPLNCTVHANTAASNCTCIAGKIEMFLWMGLHRQKFAFENFLPPGFHLKMRDYDMCVGSPTLLIEIRAFLSRAKLTTIGDISVVKNPFVRINALNYTRETKTKQKTSAPVWNQVLKIQKLIFTSADRLAVSPPVVVIELFDCDVMGKTELIGRCQLQPVLDDRQSMDYAPRLQWHEIYKGTENMGQILMSLQLLQIPEVLLKNTVYSTTEETYYTTSARDLETMTDMEPFPSNLVPKSSSYKIDVYWWGLRDVKITRKPCVVLEIDDLTIKSDIITDKKSNSNFPNGRTSHLFEGPLEEVYAPSLSIKLYDSSTFGRTMFLGTNVIKNPKKYAVNWLVKTERELSLKSGSVTSAYFCPGPLEEVYAPSLSIKLYDSSTFGRTMFLGTNVIKNPKKYAVNWLVKTERELSLKSGSVTSAYFCPVTNNQVIIMSKNNQSVDENYENQNMKSRKNNLAHVKVKRFSWARFFSNNELHEEEYTLLPVHKSEKKHATKKNLGFKRNSGNCWWLRFYSSHKEYTRDDTNPGNSDITIYDSELEQQPGFSKFKDWCATVKLYNGKKTGILKKDEQLRCGFLKAGIAIYKWPPPEHTVAVSQGGVELNKGYFADYPSNDPAKFLVRVYIIKGINILTKDYTGKSDPYIIISCGKKNIGDRNSYVPNTVNPIFGKMYEFRCTLPEDYLLTVSLYDYDAIIPDELIGSTSIDLEDRIYSKHRACVGIPPDYETTGPGQWRNSVKPSTILEDLCAKNNLPAPIFPDSHSVIVNSVEYSYSLRDKKVSPADQKEKICLSLLQKWDTLPVCGYPLVPEHVETRSLYNPDKGGHEQGKIQLWVDIFPLTCSKSLSDGIPAPINIDPEEGEDYELRIIVWDVCVNTHSYNFDESGINFKTADLYVKVWLGYPENTQSTDIHHNCTNGEASFNWRMIFQFMYHHAKQKLVKKHQGPFTERMEYSEPYLTFHLMDNIQHELLGSLALALNSIPLGSKLARNSILEEEEDIGRVNLFRVKSTRGWWPLVDLSSGTVKTIGAMKLDLVVLELDKAVCMPVGIGRDKPGGLPQPKRDTPIQNAVKSFFCGTLENGPIVLLIIVILAILLITGYLIYITTPILLHEFSSDKSKAYQKHTEGIIRTLHPVD